MARSNSSGKELTWKPYGKRKGKVVKGGQWVKVIDGKQKSFGSASRKSDRKAYGAALAKMRDYTEEQGEERQLQKVARAFMDAKVKALGMPSGLGTTSIETLDPLAAEEQAARDELARVIERSRRLRQAQEVRQAADSEPGESRLFAIMDAYYADRRQDRDITVSGSGSISNKRSLTEAGYKSIETHLNTFRAFASNCPFNAVLDVERVLSRYADFLRAKLESRAYTAWTVNTKTAKLRTFVKWAVEKHFIDAMPANLTSVTASYATKKGGKPIPLEDIRKLWRAADDRMKCWIALGLNCGYYPVDIGRLKSGEVVGGRIIRHRSKTNAQQNYKLWPVTAQLIESTRQGGPGDPEAPLWLRPDGRPFDQGATNPVGAMFAKLRERAGVGDVTFSNLRDTGASEIEKISRAGGKIDPALVSLYLSHHDDRTAAYYVSADPRDMETSTLDAATDRLGAWTGLEA